MGLWDRNTPAETPAPATDKKPSGLEGMLLNWLAANPQIKESFEGIQRMLQSFHDTQQRIERKLDLCLSQQALILKETLANATVTEHGEARGIVADGQRCPQCGSDGECHPSCPLGNPGTYLNGSGSGPSGDGGGNDSLSG